MRNNILKDAHSVWLDGYPFYFSYRNPFRLHLWGEAMILKQLQSFSLWNWFSTDYNDTRRVGKGLTHFFAGFITSLTIAVQPPNQQHWIYHWLYTYKKSAHHSRQADSISVIEILYKASESSLYKKCLATHHEQPSIQSLQK